MNNSLGYFPKNKNKLNIGTYDFHKKVFLSKYVPDKYFAPKIFLKMTPPQKKSNVVITFYSCNLIGWFL